MYRSRSAQGLSVLAINIEESQPTVAAWARERKLTLPVLLDADGDVTRRYRVTATPTVLVIDRELRVVGRIVGPRDWDSPQANALISGLLATPPRR